MQCHPGTSPDPASRAVRWNGLARRASAPLSSSVHPDILDGVPPTEAGVQSKMSRAAHARPSATAADLLAIPEARRFHEIVGGELVEKAAPSGEHGVTQAAVAGSLFGPFSRPPGGGLPGGWWFGTEVEIELETHEIYRPDVAGWRRDRAPQRPTGIPVRLRPDWICEILSPSTARNDQITKLETYRRCGVPHYWIADPQQRTLLVYRLTPDGYLLALTADASSGRIRAEPFEAIEIEVAVLLGGDTEEG